MLKEEWTIAIKQNVLPFTMIDSGSYRAKLCEVREKVGGQSPLFEYVIWTSSDEQSAETNVYAVFSSLVTQTGRGKMA